MPPGLPKNLELSWFWRGGVEEGGLYLLEWGRLIPQPMRTKPYKIGAAARYKAKQAESGYLQYLLECSAILLLTQGRFPFLVDITCRFSAEN